MLTEKITNEIKQILNGFNEQQMYSKMLSHYKLLHLVDDAEKWATMTLQEISSELLPSDMTEEKSKNFIDEVARLVRENPYLVSFLEKAENKEFKYLADKVEKEGGELFPDVVAYAQVLERLTRITHDSPKILEECIKIFKKERKKLSFLKHGSLFYKIKLMSIEKPVIEDIILKSLRIGKLPSDSGRLILAINILEACLADIVGGNISNAKVARVLARNKVGAKDYNQKTGEGPTDWSEDGKTICFRPPLPKEWVDLYQTWNMAFVAQSRSFPYVICKLLIPQVASYQTDPSQYLHKRVLALYFCLNFIIFDCARRTEAGIPEIEWNDTELVRLWGNINLENAKKYQLELSRMDQVRTF